MPAALKANSLGGSAAAVGVVEGSEPPKSSAGSCCSVRYPVGGQERVGASMETVWAVVVSVGLVVGLLLAVLVRMADLRRRDRRRPRRGRRLGRRRPRL